MDPFDRLEKLYGPLTARSKAGLLPETARLSSYEPTRGEKAASYFDDLGPIGERLKPVARFVGDNITVPAEIATEIVKQPVRAGEAVGEAVLDPTLANVTNAGVQTAITAFRPAAAAGVYGLGLLEGARRDAGVSGIDSAIAAKKQKRSGYTPVELPGLTPEQNAQYNQARQKIAAGDFQSGAERRTLEADANRLADLSARYTERQSDAEREAQSAKEAQRQAEYGRAVDKAEGAYDREMARDRRFSDTELGKVWGKTGPLTPMLFGAGAGAVAKIAGHSPALHGTLAGALSSNIPLIGDAIFTEADNPKRRAYEAKLENLPADHPERAQIEAMLADETRLPKLNPIREAASEELYNPVKLGERLGLGALEGFGAGAFAGHAIDVPGALVRKGARLPGQARKSFRESWNEPLDLPPTSQAAGARPPVSQELPSLGSVDDAGRLPPAIPQQSRGPSISGQELTPTPGTGQSPKTDILPSAVSDLPPVVIIRSASGRTHHMGDSGRFAKKDLYSRKPAPAKESKRAKAQKAAPAVKEKTPDSDTAEDYLNDPSKLTKGMWTGGRVGYASGGAVHEPIHAGPLNSTVAGRTDHHPISVMAGSYVLPADIISALGEGNTAAGMLVIDQMFPKETQQLKYARGGKVPIAAAGGEFVLTPEQVAAVGGGDIDVGHQILDDWVRKTRAQTIQTLQSLPGPAK